MSHIAKTAFEVSNSNITRNTMQNLPGYFGSYSGSTFTPDICPAGFLVAKSKLAASEGYEGYGPSSADILNGNTWTFVAAANGTSGGAYGDHTGIYAFNSYDVNKATDGAGNIWNIGANTFGMELPAGERGTFTELIVGEQYTFGEGNFSTAPAGAAYIYCTISNGRLVASNSAPDGGTGVYLKIWRSKGFTVGARDAGVTGYVCEVCRTAEAAAED